MKKILSLAVTAVMLSSPAVSAKTYDDVPSNAWFREAVDFVSERGIMPAGGRMFYPYAHCSRAEYVYALYKSSSESEKEYIPAFSDVEAGGSFSSAIGWAQQCGITSGVNLIYTSQAQYASDNPDNFQNTVVFIGSTQDKNTLIRLADKNNKEIISFCPINKFEAVTITSPQIHIGRRYILTIGGNQYDIDVSQSFTKLTRQRDAPNGIP